MNLMLWLRRLGCWLAGGIFLYAGIPKALDPLAFAGSVAAYELLPYAANLVVAATLPWVEIVAGIFLVVGWRVRPALLVLILLDLAFMAAIVSAQLRGLTIDCGCFRPGAGDSDLITALLRDLLLLGLLLATWWLLRRESASPPPEVRP
ncbi:MAG: DoxX family protein [Desulfuromonas sp.]|mgnify:CR=1 FL=1|nr:MAG: DoxX family protein [Desulfuromonas sp.]